MLELWGTYENINFFINRKKPYSKVGRTQSESEAKFIDGEIRDLLWQNDISHINVDGTETCADEILEHIKVLARSGMSKV